MPSTDALECRPGPALAPVLNRIQPERLLLAVLVVRRLLPYNAVRYAGCLDAVGRYDQTTPEAPMDTSGRGQRGPGRHSARSVTASDHSCFRRSRRPDACSR